MPSERFQRVSKQVKRFEMWGGRRELNPQRPEPQSGALPIELLPPYPVDYSNWVEKLSERLSGKESVPKKEEKLRARLHSGLGSPDAHVFESHGAQAH